MTQTLTTDELRQIVDSHEKGYGMSVPINYGYLAARELLATREAQPVGVMNIGSETCSDYLVAWTKAGALLGKGVHWLYTAQPAAVVNPEFTGAPAVPDEKAITPFFDTIALDTAKMVMCDVNRRSDFLGGDIQLLARIQCRVDEACRAAMLGDKP
jgi:hypothetical protein